jgi:hypothetical protein
VPTIIGLGHKARQGKNYVADFMKAEDNRVKTYAFADELKLYCKEHHDELVPRWQLWHQTKQLPTSKADPIYGYTPILQWWGTEIARKENPDCWVQALDNRLSTDNPEVAVITDIRFPNEAEYIKQKAGYLCEVVRLKSDGTQFVDTGRDPNHPSETALNDYPYWDFTILCKDGDLKNLKRKSIGVLNIAKGNFTTYDELVDKVYSLESMDDYYYTGEYIDDAPDGYKSEPTVD